MSKSVLFAGVVVVAAACASTPPTPPPTDGRAALPPSSDADVRARCVAAARTTNAAQLEKMLVAKGMGPEFAAADAAFEVDHMLPTFGRICDCAADGVGGWQSYAQDPARAAASIAPACQDKAMAGLAAESPTPQARAEFIATWAAAHPGEKVAATPTSTTGPLSPDATAAARAGCVQALRQPNEAQFKKRALEHNPNEAFATDAAAFAMDASAPAFATICDCIADSVGGWSVFVTGASNVADTPAAAACQEKALPLFGAALSKEAMTSFRDRWIATHPGQSVFNTPSASPPTTK